MFNFKRKEQKNLEEKLRILEEENQELKKQKEVIEFTEPKLGYNFTISYEEDFVEFFTKLIHKYSDKIFDIEGIGKQLDFSKFSKDFFSTKTTTADVSVDANANVDEMSVIAYQVEMPKPFFRINALYLLWKYGRQLYGNEEAEKIIEGQISGDYYINDLSTLNSPYSYFGDTPITIIENGQTRNISLRSLYEEFESNAIDNQITSFDQKVPYGIKKREIFVLDQNKNANVKITRILRHKRHNDLLVITTKNGHTTIVTEDHPVILQDGSSKNADQLTTKDVLSPSGFRHSFSNRYNYSPEMGYFIGFYLGDGCTTSGAVNLYQKDIESYPNLEKLKTAIGETNFSFSESRKMTICSKELKDFLNNLGLKPYASGKCLPENIWETNQAFARNIISGLIDSDGSINPDNGLISIRICSYALAQQIKEVLYALNINSTIRATRVPLASANTYRQQYELFNVSFRLDNSNFYNFIDSLKISENVTLVSQEKNAYIHWNDFTVESIRKLTGKHNDLYDGYVYDITTTSGHFASCGMTQHNCFNFSTYDVALQGLPFVKKIISGPPKHLSSFVGQMIHFTVYASNSIAGACGLADFLIVMAYYVDKLKKESPYKDEQSLNKAIKQELQSFIYSCNQPFRGGHQSGFYNISIFDRVFLEKMIKDYIFEDNIVPEINTVLFLQNMYLDLMNETMTITPITFPVTTGCFATQEINGKIEVIDKEYLKYMSEKNLEFGFINFYFGKTSTLSSCCRLRSDSTNEYFNSFGSGSSKIGSLGVVSLNLPRIAYQSKTEDEFIKRLEELAERAIKINNIKRFLLRKRIRNNNLPLYDYGFMDLNKQYSTIGDNGINEAVEEMGLDILKPDGQVFVKKILSKINEVNDRAQKQYKTPHNQEQVPAENSSIKMADKDRLLGFQNKYSLYSNQFIPLTTKADLLDRIRLQGLFDSSMSGGAICHLNVEQKITDVNKMYNLLIHSAEEGVIYLAINYTILQCPNNHMTIGKTKTCSICGEPISTEYTRVVGFLTATKNWSKTRRQDDWPNRVFYDQL